MRHNSERISHQDMIEVRRHYDVLVFDEKHNEYKVHSIHKTERDALDCAKEIDSGHDVFVDCCETVTTETTYNTGTITVLNDEK